MLYFLSKIFFLLTKEIVHLAVHFYKAFLFYNLLNIFSNIKVKAFRLKLVLCYFDELLNRVL